MTRVLGAMLIATVAVASLAAQQRDTRPTPAAASAVPPAPTGTASIAGQIVADATGAPVGLASVVLIGSRTGVLKVGSSDREGKFVFGALPADRYTVGASRPPYLGAVAGARRPARPGSPVVVADGATVSDVTIRMPLGAALSGTVYDQNGQPAAGIPVGVMQRKVQNGERVLVNVPVAMSPTDDRGQYRVHGLTPGEYVITAMAIHQPRSARALTDADVDMVLAGSVPAETPTDAGAGIPAPVFYPGTTRSDEAAGVLVAAGDDRTGLDIQLRLVQPAVVSGVVTTADGSPLPPQVSLQLRGAPGSSPLITGGAVSRLSPGGTFTFPNMLPNTYVIVASGGSLRGVATVQVDGADASGVSVVLRPPMTLTGRVATAGPNAPRSLAGLRFQFTPLSMALSGLSAPQASPTTATGEFRISNVVETRYLLSGEPFFGASADSVTWGLGTVVVDGVDMTDRAIDISVDRVPKDIVVTLTDTWQDISGRVTNTENAGVSDYTMLVFPADEAYWLFNSRRVATAQPDNDGHYQLGGPGPAFLPPGDYYLAAVTDASKDEQYDPAFLRSLIPSAIRLALAPGQRLTQDLKVQ
jgi:hypothetical protein